MCPKTQEEIEYMSRVPYSSTIGSLMYAMVCTRPDIAHAVGVVRRYMNNLGKEHWEEVKWILRYLRGTATHALCFGGSDTVLQGYVDSDMVGDKDSRRSTIVTPCFPQFVINHKIGITMLLHEDNVNVLFFELPMTDCGGEDLKVLAMISLEE
jgi:hypothetical protein